MVHSYSPIKGKDAADFEMVTTGIEVALKYPQLSTFIIVSGDIVFRPLVTSLRRNGKEVYEILLTKILKITFMLFTFLN